MDNTRVAGLHSPLFGILADCSSEYTYECMRREQREGEATQCSSVYSVAGQEQHSSSVCIRNKLFAHLSLRQESYLIRNGFFSSKWPSYSVQRISLSLLFSSSPPKITSIPFLTKAHTSDRLSLKCWITSEYSLERGLPNTPTSSVCNPRSVFGFDWLTTKNDIEVAHAILTHKTTTAPSTFHHSRK